MAEYDEREEQVMLIHDLFWDALSKRNLAARFLFGNTIPSNILDKIFQPFFTTKPIGQGTGLGLSLSYDIIKVLGGKLIVNTEVNNGSEFIIELPIKNA